MLSLAEALAAVVVAMLTQKMEKQVVVPSLVQVVAEEEKVLVLIQQTVGLAVPGAVMP